MADDLYVSNHIAVLEQFDWEENATVIRANEPGGIMAVTPAEACSCRCPTTGRTREVQYKASSFPSTEGRLSDRPTFFSSPPAEEVFGALHGPSHPLPPWTESIYSKWN